jgi:exopolysaccharide biosynthesis protein
MRGLIMRLKNRKKSSVLFLLALVCCISIAYAYLSTNLSITGNSTLKSQKWSVYFDNVQVTDGSVEATVEPSTEGKTTTSISYTVDLNKPGEFYEFTVDVVNDGTIDAMLDSFTTTKLSEEQLKYLDYTVTYSDNSEIEQYDVIESGTYDTVLVRIQLKEDINIEDLPTDDVQLTLDLDMNYVPADDSAIIKNAETIIADELLLKNVWGSNSDSSASLRTLNTRITTATPIEASAGDSFTMKQTSTYEFGYFFLTYSEGNDKYYFTEDNGWQTGVSSQDITINIPEDTLLVVNFRRSDNKVVTEDDLEAIKELITYNKASKSSSSSSDDEEIDTQSLIAKETTIDNYDKCYVVTIPSTLSDGTKITPHVALTASTVGGKDITSAYTYATKNNYSVVSNAGLFNTSTKQPQGQTIIDGVSITNSPMTDDMGSKISDEECYPLAIDSNGYLSAPYSRSVDTSTMINDGVTNAVTGWMAIIDNGVAKYDDYDTVEIVHKGTYTRQVIGQYEDGDYFILTTNNTNKSSGGMKYSEITSLLLSLDKKVRFAYALDGGGSTETVVAGSQVNPIYENSPIGRSVPSVIYFDK